MSKINPSLNYFLWYDLKHGIETNFVNVSVFKIAGPMFWLNLRFTQDWVLLKGPMLTNTHLKGILTLEVNLCTASTLLWKGLCPNMGPFSLLDS